MNPPERKTMTTNLHIVASTSSKLNDFSMYHFSDLASAPFDKRDYSRMKFGSNRAARRFGYDMADRFFHLYRDALETPCVVIPAPSTTVSVAATMLSRHFMNRLNEHLDTFSMEPVEWTLIHRNMTYNNNYAHLPKEERKKLLAADTIYLNREFVAGKTLIFVDDVRITGTHEEKIASYLEEIGLSNPHLFVTLASYEGQDAAIEGRLNHVEINDAHDLVLLSHEVDYEVTTRSLRLLLEAAEQDFAMLLKQAPARFREMAYHAAIVKGYNRHEPYATNFAKLKASVG
jgi:predicted amidophosphoribosyltransferase